MKNKIKNVLFVTLVAVVSSALTSLVINNNFSGNRLLGSVSHSDYLDSSNVTYSDSNVQDSIDNLYTQANDYSSINTRVNTLEGYFKNNPTSYFEGRNLWMNGNGTSGDTGIYFMQNNVSRAEISVTSSGNLQIFSNDSSGTTGQGSLNIKGNPVTVNGVEVAHKPTIKQILKQSNIPTTATSYSCDWVSYDFLIIMAGDYSNIHESIIVPKDYFINTHDVYRVQINNDYFSSKRTYDIYKNGNNAVYLKAGQTENPNQYVTIYGVKF